MRWLVLVPFALGCMHDAPAPPVAKPVPAPVVAPVPPKPPRLFSEAEIAASIADVLGRIGANATRSCPAPRVLAAMTPGSSVPALVTIFEGSDDCAIRLSTANTLKADLDAQKPEALALAKDCAEPLAAAIHLATSFDDGCSPYQLGVHVPPEIMMAPIRIAHILGFHAQQGKDPAVAVGELLELLRALQDSARGHVTLVSTMIAVASSEIVAARLDAILGSAKLGKAQLEDFAGALDRLIAAVPPFSDTLEGEREAQELYLGVGGLEPPDWSPPGGWMEGMRPQSDATTEHVADPRDEAAALLASVEQSAAARALACPAGATLAACRDGLDKLGAAPAPDHLDVAALWKQGMTDEPGMRMKMRQQIVDILASISQADFHRYVEKVAGSLARLAELRIHVEVLRTHKCDPATLAKLSPAALGAPLDIHADKRELVVGAWTMHCR